jgi:uncharacterized RmlC-like cupin family protein
MSNVARCVLVSRGERYTGTQGLTYGTGLTGATTGAKGLCLTEAELPPGACSRAHLHRGIETGGYVLEGTLETLWGERLEQSVVAEAGEFVCISPDVPHVVRNPSGSGRHARSSPTRQPTTRKVSSCGLIWTHCSVSLPACPPVRVSPVSTTS